MTDSELQQAVEKMMFYYSRAVMDSVIISPKDFDAVAAAVIRLIKENT